MGEEKDIWNIWIIRASTLNKAGNTYLSTAELDTYQT